MYQYLTLSRAARLVGVKRGTLQKRIQDGDILTFEGMLFIDDLLKAYPDTKLADDTMIERSRYNKEHATAKPIHEATILPSSEILTARVHKLSSDLLESEALAKKYIAITQALQTKLEQLASEHNTAADLNTWFKSAIDEPLDSNTGKDQLIASDALLSLMTAHIRILPSGHDFFVEGTSNLLEAGLRAGLSLNYACSNGNCGQCKARLISGEVKKIAQHDYRLTDADKANGYILMCCNAPVSDITLEALEAGSSEDIPQQTITAKVKTLDTSHGDVALLHLKTPRTQRLRFLAGQYVTFGDDLVPAADLSVSSCPCDDMNLHFQVPNIPEDAFSSFVFNQLKSGDSLTLSGPKGDFTLNEDSYNSLVFIAWHTGFAAIRSLVEHAMAIDSAESITLVWIAASKHDRYLDNLCRSWKDALDNFIYIPIVADISTADNDNVIQSIIENIESLDQNDIYVSGNAVLLDNCKRALSNKNFDEEQLKLDLITHA